MSSSRVLQCLELCRLICEQIGSDDKRTLFQLCLSCKALMEPALDLLWHELDSIVPLMGCLPWDLYEEGMMWREDLQRNVVLAVSNGFLSASLIFTTNPSIFEDQW